MVDPKEIQTEQKPGSTADRETRSQGRGQAKGRSRTVKSVLPARDAERTDKSSHKREKRKEIDAKRPANGDDLICFNCRQAGHKRSDCPAPAKDRNSPLPLEQHKARKGPKRPGPPGPGEGPIGERVENFRKCVTKTLKSWVTQIHDQYRPKLDQVTEMGMMVPAFECLPDAAAHQHAIDGMFRDHVVREALVQQLLTKYDGLRTPLIHVFGSSRAVDRLIAVINRRAVTFNLPLIRVVHCDDNEERYAHPDADVLRAPWPVQPGDWVAIECYVDKYDGFTEDFLRARMAALRDQGTSFFWAGINFSRPVGVTLEGAYRHVGQGMETYPCISSAAVVCRQRPQWLFEVSADIYKRVASTCGAHLALDLFVPVGPVRSGVSMPQVPRLLSEVVRVPLPYSSSSGWVNELTTSMLSWPLVGDMLRRNRRWADVVIYTKLAANALADWRAQPVGTYSSKQVRESMKIQSLRDPACALFASFFPEYHAEILENSFRHVFEQRLLLIPWYQAVFNVWTNQAVAGNKAMVDLGKVETQKSALVTGVKYSLLAAGVGGAVWFLTKRSELLKPAAAVVNPRLYCDPVVARIGAAFQEIKTWDGWQVTRAAQTVGCVGYTAYRLARNETGKTARGLLALGAMVAIEAWQLDKPVEYLPVTCALRGICEEVGLRSLGFGTFGRVLFAGADDLSNAGERGTWLYRNIFHTVMASLPRPVAVLAHGSNNYVVTASALANANISVSAFSWSVLWNWLCSWFETAPVLRMSEEWSSFRRSIMTGPWEARMSIRDWVDSVAEGIYSFDPADPEAFVEAETEGSFDVSPELKERHELALREISRRAVPLSGTYWMYPCSAWFGRPSNSDAMKVAALFARCYVQPPMARAEQERRWAILPSPTQGMDVHTVFFGPAWPEISYDFALVNYHEHMRLAPKRRRDRFMKAYEDRLVRNYNLLSHEVHKKQVFVKSDELLGKLDDAGRPAMKPRMIVADHAGLLVNVAPSVYEAMQRLHQVWSVEQPRVVTVSHPRGLNWTCYLSYACGNSQHELSDWMEVAEARPARSLSIMVHGDDQVLVLIDAHGVLHHAEGDYSHYDWSQGPGPLRYELDALRWLGVPEEAIGLLSAGHAASFSAFCKDNVAFKVVRGRMAASRVTGASDTSVGNSIVNGRAVVACAAKLIRSGAWDLGMSDIAWAGFESAFSELGFKIKFEVVRSGAPTFLKGWWIDSRDGQGRVRRLWTPLPSRILKLGKSWEPLHRLYKPLRGEVLTINDRVALFMRDQALGLASYAGLDPLLAAVAEVWQHGPDVRAVSTTLRLDSLRLQDWQIAGVPGTSKLILDDEALDRALYARYGIRLADLRRLAFLVRDHGANPGFIVSPVLAELAARDYG